MVSANGCVKTVSYASFGSEISGNLRKNMNLCPKMQINAMNLEKRPILLVGTKVWLGIASGTNAKQKERRMEWRMKYRCGELLHEAGIQCLGIVPRDCRMIAIVPSWAPNPPPRSRGTPLWWDFLWRKGGTSGGTNRDCMPPKKRLLQHMHWRSKPRPTETCPLGRMWWIKMLSWYGQQLGFESMKPEIDGCFWWNVISQWY